MVLTGERRAAAVEGAKGGDLLVGLHVQSNRLAFQETSPIYG
jgi:hypothetical protein